MNLDRFVTTAMHCPCNPGHVPPASHSAPGKWSKVPGRGDVAGAAQQIVAGLARHEAATGKAEPRCRASR